MMRLNRENKMINIRIQLFKKINLWKNSLKRKNNF